MRRPVPVEPAGAPRVYAGATTASVALLSAAVILLTVTASPAVGATARSAALGLGLVCLSTGLTVLVSVLMYRAAPAATAPALAVLYLAKVTSMGWWLLARGAPQWLQATAFAVTVVAALVASWLVLAPLAARTSAAVARHEAARAPAGGPRRTPGEPGDVSPPGGPVPGSDEPGGDHGHP